jgi:hypothetical protein
MIHSVSSKTGVLKDSRFFLPDDFQLTPHVGAGLLAIQAPQSSRQTASSFIASKPAPTG